jgi:imidazolonepropionase-like amidohydrolase
VSFVYRAGMKRLLALLARLAPLASLASFASFACAPAAPLPVQPAAAAPKAAPRAAPSASIDMNEDKMRAVIEPTAAPAQVTVVLQHATVLTGTGARFDDGYVAIADGRITGVGGGAGSVPPGGKAIDARGKFVTPGIIDVHSHMGVYAVPFTEAHADGNEMTDPITAGIRAEDSFWPQDPAIERAVAAGVTTIAALPGSANLIGGRGVVMHLLPQRGARAMRFPGAPEILKMACGENPKRVYGEQKRAPATRMANLRAVREAFLKAQKYARDWDDYKKSGAAGPPPDGGPPKSPDRDLGMETLALVMRGDILVEWHCYQADDMLAALQIADEFGFHVRAFHHALEAYKIRDVLAAKHVGVATWEDWYGFKMEAYDGIPENLALTHEAGGRAIVHSDSEIAIQMLNQSAAKALAAGRAAGVTVSEDDAMKWLTANPAWALGIDDQVGTLEQGKRADVVVWSGNPFSAFTRADEVIIDGRPVYERGAPSGPWSDFELGLRAGASDGGRP